MCLWPPIRASRWWSRGDPPESTGKGSEKGLALFYWEAARISRKREQGNPGKSDGKAQKPQPSTARACQCWQHLWQFVLQTAWAITGSLYPCMYDSWEKEFLFLSRCHLYLFALNLCSHRLFLSLCIWLSGKRFCVLLIQMSSVSLWLELCDLLWTAAL